MAYAALFIPEFPVAARLRCAPELNQQPLAIFDGVAPLEYVCALNQEARKLSVIHGMSRVEAEACGRIAGLRRSIEGEEAAFRAVMETAERFSPRIEAVRAPANGYGGAERYGALVLLDQAGTETLFGTRSDYAHALHAAAAALGFEVHVTLAGNAQTAMLMARSCEGVRCIGDHESADRLAPLPVSVLELSEELANTFRRWGIATLGELAALPEKALVSRLGLEARRLQRLARGEEGHVLVPTEVPFSLHEHRALDTPIELLDSLLFLLSPMLEQLLHRARERAYALQSLSLDLTLEGSRLHRVEVRPASPSQDRTLLLKLLHLEIEARPPEAGVLALTLCGEPARPHVAQRGLFQAQFPESQKLDLLLARLRAIAGEASVGAPSLTNTRREDRYLLTSFHPGEHAGTPRLAAGQAAVALRRLRPPEAARVRLKENAPVSLDWNALRLPVLEAFGPWQSSGQWWTTEPWATDEWDVIAVEPPMALRLCRERLGNIWYVAGIYD